MIEGRGGDSIDVQAAAEISKIADKAIKEPHPPVPKGFQAEPIDLSKET